MQNVLGYSPIQAGAAYLPVTVGIGISAAVVTPSSSRARERDRSSSADHSSPQRRCTTSRASPSDGSYFADVLPGLLVMSLGLGSVLVAVTTAANAGVPADQAGLAAGLLNTSQQLGSALGLAIFSAIATARTQSLLTRRSRAAGSPDRRLPAGPARLRDLPARRRTHRHTRHQHPLRKPSSPAPESPPVPDAA